MDLSFSIETKKGDEYLVAVIDADITPLSVDIQQMLLKHNLQIGEIIIDHRKGNQYTDRKVLHKITNELANIFAENQKTILAGITIELYQNQGENNTNPNGYFIRSL